MVPASFASAINYAPMPQYRTSKRSDPSIAARKGTKGLQASGSAQSPIEPKYSPRRVGAHLQPSAAAPILECGGLPPPWFYARLASRAFVRHFEEQPS